MLTFEGEQLLPKKCCFFVNWRKKRSLQKCWKWSLELEWAWSRARAWARILGPGLSFNFTHEPLNLSELELCRALELLGSLEFAWSVSSFRDLFLTWESFNPTSRYYAKLELVSPESISSSENIGLVRALTKPHKTCSQVGNSKKCWRRILSRYRWHRYSAKHVQCLVSSNIAPLVFGWAQQWENLLVAHLVFAWLKAYD